MKGIEPQQEYTYPTSWIGGISKWERDLIGTLFAVKEKTSWENPRLRTVRTHLYRALREFIENYRPLLLAESTRAISWPFPETSHEVRETLRKDIPGRGERHGVYMTTIDEVVESLHPEAEKVVIEGLSRKGSAQVREIIHTGEEMLLDYVEPRLKVEGKTVRYNPHRDPD